MGKKVLLNCHFEIDSDDLTNWTVKVELEDTFEVKETTTYGSGGAKESLAGLEEGSIKVVFRNDFSAGQLDEIMWAKRRQVVPFVIRPEKGTAKGADNPEYTGNILINGWTPIAGSVGDVAEVDREFPMSGPLVRSTN